MRGLPAAAGAELIENIIYLYRATGDPWLIDAETTKYHPIDPAALHCCSGLSEKEVKNKIALEMVDIVPQE